MGNGERDQRGHVHMLTSSTSPYPRELIRIVRATAGLAEIYGSPAN